MAVLPPVADAPGREVLPICPFLHSFIEAHEECLDSVPTRDRRPRREVGRGGDRGGRAQAGRKAKLGSVEAPKAVHFFRLLPRSPQGKVLKRTRRDEFWADRDRTV